MPNDGLSRLKRKAERDKELPLRESASNLVFGAGNADSKVLFIGEAPGKSEDLEGEPFVGAAGKFLNKLLELAGLKREDVFITNVVFYRPPNNRPPTQKELAAFSPYVGEIVKIINPKVIVTLGRFSLAHFLPDEKISQIHGVTKQITIYNNVGMLVPMYHPSAGLRSPEIRKVLEEDFRKLRTVLDP